MHLKPILRNKLVLIPLFLCSFLCLLALSISTYVMYSTKDCILSVPEASKLSQVDCILVLGCSIWGQHPSPMLGDRLDRAIELYANGAAPCLLMSGDDDSVYYNEVKVMKDYATASGVPSSAVFLDHDGFSTYESICRLRDVFGAKKVLIVTQGYHLYRALYIAEHLGLDAYGVASDQRTYQGQLYRSLREVAARDKDFFNIHLFQPPLPYDTPVSLIGDGDTTNERPLLPATD